MDPSISQHNLKTPPPHVTDAKISFPQPFVLVVALSRPKVLNCVNMAGHKDLSALWEWFDHEPALRVGIITGEGRAFCAGADLKEWKVTGKTPVYDVNGFGGLSTRSGRKPVIAAVNGLCFGGGFEMVINCDMVIASSDALFALPEVKIGVVAAGGSIPRLVQAIGRQRASEVLLTGRRFTAEEMRDAGLVNRVIEGAGVEVLAEALRMAGEIAAASPDAVLVTREGMKMVYEQGMQEATETLLKTWYPKIENRKNMAEGVRAFSEKRDPVWEDYDL